MLLTPGYGLTLAVNKHHIIYLILQRVWFLRKADYIEVEGVLSPQAPEEL